MVIELTKEQQRQIDDASRDQHMEVVDSRGRRRYILVPADEYDALQDDRDQAAMVRVSARNLASRLKEDV
jgi:hypothetical protein